MTDPRALTGEVLRLEDGEWRRLIVAERREGFIVRDRRRVFPVTTTPKDTDRKSVV